MHAVRQNQGDDKNRSLCSSTKRHHLPRDATKTMTFFFSSMFINWMRGGGVFHLMSTLIAYQRVSLWYGYISSLTTFSIHAGWGFELPLHALYVIGVWYQLRRVSMTTDEACFNPPLYTHTQNTILTATTPKTAMPELAVIIKEMISWYRTAFQIGAPPNICPVMVPGIVIKPTMDMRLIVGSIASRTASMAMDLEASKRVAPKERYVSIRLWFEVSSDKHAFKLTAMELAVMPSNKPMDGMKTSGNQKFCSLMA